jgi:hypothetical protein
MPSRNWFNMFDNNDLTQLSRTGKVCKHVDEVFERVKDEFMETFGISEDFMKLQRKRIELELLLCKQVQTGNMSDQFFIDFLQDEIKEMQQYKTAKNNLWDTIPWVEHEMGGMHIDTFTTTVFEYYNRVKFVMKKAEAKAKPIPKNNKK